MNVKNNKKELTICSAYHSRETKDILELNWRLTRVKNTKHNWEWLVADNTPPDFPREQKIDERKFTVIPGFDNKPFINSPVRASFPISHALNKLTQHVKTSFVLYLDSDFFLVRDEWIRDVLEYMKAKDLSFLGTPWHPRWFKKIRYFPAEHALFVDLQKINKNTLDFMPAMQENPKVLSTVTKLPLPSFLKKSIQGRLQIGTSRDVAYNIFSRYNADDTIRQECFIPVFRPYENLNFMRKTIKKFTSLFLPDRLSYIPKKRGYFTDKGMREFGHPDITSFGWEEFMWKGKPFGFHMRRTQKEKGREFGEEFLMLQETLESIGNQ